MPVRGILLVRPSALPWSKMRRSSYPRSAWLELWNAPSSYQTHQEPCSLRHNPRACGNSHQLTWLSQSKKSSTTTTSILSTLIMISLSLIVGNPSSHTCFVTHIKEENAPGSQNPLNPNLSYRASSRIGEPQSSSYHLISTMFDLCVLRFLHIFNMSCFIV